MITPRYREQPDALLHSGFVPCADPEHRAVTDSHNVSNNQQRIKNTEPPPKKGKQRKPLGEGAGGLKCILLVPNLRPRIYCC